MEDYINLNEPESAYDASGNYQRNPMQITKVKKLGQGAQGEVF